MKGIIAHVIVKICFVSGTFKPVQFNLDKYDQRFKSHSFRLGLVKIFVHSSTSTREATKLPICKQLSKLLPHCKKLQKLQIHLFFIVKSSKSYVTLILCLIIANPSSREAPQSLIFRHLSLNHWCLPRALKQSIFLVLLYFCEP